MMNTEVLLVLVGAIAGIVTIVQTIVSGWKQDKDDFSILREEYQDALQKLYRLEAQVEAKDQVILQLTTQLAVKVREKIEAKAELDTKTEED